MKKIFKIILITLMTFSASLALYMFTSIFIPLPFPKWYTEMERKQTEYQVTHDPFFILANEANRIKNERDSLQHIVDSLIVKK